MSTPWYYIDDPRNYEEFTCDNCKRPGLFERDIEEFGEDILCRSCYEERDCDNVFSLEQSITEEEYEIFEMVQGGSDNA